MKGSLARLSESLLWPAVAAVALLYPVPETWAGGTKSCADIPGLETQIKTLRNQRNGATDDTKLWKKKNGQIADLHKQIRTIRNDNKPGLCYNDTNPKNEWSCEDVDPLNATIQRLRDLRDSVTPKGGYVWKQYDRRIRDREVRIELINDANGRPCGS